MNIYVIQFVNLLGTILWVAMLGRVIMSWINVSPSNPLYVIVFQLTEPILAPIRRVLPKMGMMDLSPMIAILLITVVQRLLLRFLG